MMSDTPDAAPDSGAAPKSKSQLKREMQALQALGRELLGKPSSLLAELPLSERLREAIVAARAMKRGALARQLRFIASLLAAEDAVAIRQALELSARPHQREVERHQQAERWRDALLDDGDPPLADLIARFPDCDRQHLRQLVRNARRERQQGGPAGPSRQLFRYLHRLLSGAD